MPNDLRSGIPTVVGQDPYWSERGYDRRVRGRPFSTNQNMLSVLCLTVKGISCMRISNNRIGLTVIPRHFKLSISAFAKFHSQS